ncbi:MAG: iron-containing alcohol dehydrogenase [Clostridia bacterium]|nr:iron-containing alcohol dehydrogenase [Clostridia bacterium]
MFLFRWGMKVYQQILKLYVLTFRIKKTVIVHEAGASKKIAEYLKKDGFTNILIITDRTILSLGLLKGMIEGLDQQKIAYHTYSDVVPNPTIENIEEAKKIYLDNKCQAIVAFGGGSVLDCAKITGVVVLSGKPVKRYDLMIPMIAKMAKLYTVPTTAGTGSEVTISAVITDTARSKKMPITDKKLAPDYAFLDAELMTGLPKGITAATGMDALTHAMEAYIGNWKFKVTDDYAIKATKIIFENLQKAYDDGNDIEARSQMALGAAYGGYAFRTAGVGYVHGIAHRLSELYHVPHGLANAIVLPHILRYFYSAIYKKLSDLSIKAGVGSQSRSEKENAMEFIEKIEALNKSLGIPVYTDKLEEKDIKLIAKRAIAEANSTYPVPYPITRKEMEKFLLTMLPNAPTAKGE